MATTRIPKIKTMRSLSIIVADDHPVVLGGLVTLLSKDKSFKVVARCANGVEAIAAIRNLKPDLALLDMNMPRPKRPADFKGRSCRELDNTCHFSRSFAE